MIIMFGESLSFSYVCSQLILRRCNYGRGRLIYGDALDGGVFVHRSVKTRLEVLDKHGQSEYTPNAWFKNKRSTWYHTKHEPHEWNTDEPTLWQWVD